MIPVVCRGGPAAGPIGELASRARFRWLVSPRSTIVQTVAGPHGAHAATPPLALERLMDTSRQACCGALDRTLTSLIARRSLTNPPQQPAFTSPFSGRRRIPAARQLTLSMRVAPRRPACSPPTGSSAQPQPLTGMQHRPCRCRGGPWLAIVPGSLSGRDVVEPDLTLRGRARRGDRPSLRHRRTAARGQGARRMIRTLIGPGRGGGLPRRRHARGSGGAAGRGRDARRRSRR